MRSLFLLWFDLCGGVVVGAVWASLGYRLNSLSCLSLRLIWTASFVAV